MYNAIPPEEIRAMLSFIPVPTDWNERRRLMISVISELDRSEMAEVTLREWIGAEPSKKWLADFKSLPSAAQIKSITIATVVKEAKKKGYKPLNPPKAVDPIAAKQREEQRAEKKREAEQKERQIKTRNDAFLQKLIEESYSLKKDLSVFPALAYLGKRGVHLNLDDLPKNLGFHPDLEYWEDRKVKGKYPALIGLMTSPQRKVVQAQRIYLNESGEKADVTEVKRKTGTGTLSTQGSSVKLYEPSQGVLAVAEGIETALAVRCATGYPTWSTVDAGGLQRLEIAGGVHTLHIFGDKDASGAGQKSASILAERMTASGIKVYIHLPEAELEEGQKSIDWLDVLKNKGARGFTKTLIAA